MTTVIFEDNNLQAKQLLEYIRTLPFATVVNQEAKKIELIHELQKGENSGFVEHFNREDFRKELYQKHIAEE
ncbi:MAG: hypothetical protein ACK5LR_01775 [Mangrovibacterium sp.]